jgi:type 1 glutamine amidotransferase
MVTVRYWVKNTWPYSIDRKIEGARMDAIRVTEEEIFLRNDKLYYKLQSGHGVNTDLLVEPPICETHNIPMVWENKWGPGRRFDCSACDREYDELYGKRRMK